MDALEQFNHKQYLNLETFRRNGESMKTPVWFVQEVEKFYILTIENSDKVKRIRNNSNVNIIPCKMDGTPVGTWVKAEAREITEMEIMANVNRLLDKKYGLKRKLFSLNISRRERRDIILEIIISKKEKMI
jgi:PPOX class probable F420-dependent enzyme